uniref:Uncharacterized protein n=1 Tax=Anguilla anguilla TaxID=7936 RepID=A0A0E9U449_ANGAN
MQTPNLGETTR